MNTELDYKYNRLKIFKQLPAVFSSILAGLKEAQRREKTRARGTNVQSESFSRKSYDHTVKLCGLCSQCLVHFDIICYVIAFIPKVGTSAYLHKQHHMTVLPLGIGYCLPKNVAAINSGCQSIYYIPCSPAILFSMIHTASWFILQLMTRQEINTVHFWFPVPLLRKQIYDFTYAIVVLIRVINRRIDHAEICRVYISCIC